MTDRLKRKITVVGIGASAGGVPALQEMLPGVPRNGRFACVVMLHLDPEHPSMLKEILQRKSTLTVKTIVDGDALDADMIYVTPPNKNCVVVDGHLRLHPLPDRGGPRQSIDVLLGSLAGQFGDRAIGIVLSGSGSDGLQGMHAIKAAGGVAIAQDPSSALSPEMPRSIIDAGLVDFILPAGKIGAELVRLKRGPKQRRVVLPSPASDVGIDDLWAALGRKKHFDFSQYKDSTLRRRLARRMAIHKLDDLREYISLVDKSDTEAGLFFSELLISVTGFFRDPATFESLDQTLRSVVRAKGRGEEIRIWIAGCATGEEAISIAILLAQALSDSTVAIPAKIFATDVDQVAVSFARRGRYLESAMTSVPKSLLEKYFTHADGVYQVNKSIRDMIVFAGHDLMRDPPYLNLDLISCRNVLIYFKRPTQERLISLFHYALKPDGYLVLGASEGIGRFTKLFRPVADHVKIYRRIGEAGNVAKLLPLHNPPRAPADKPPVRPKEALSLTALYKDLIAERYAPPGVFVNSRQEIVHVQGDVSRFLRLPPGALSVNVGDMVVVPLRLETRVVLQKAIRGRHTIRGHSIEVTDALGSTRVVPIGIPCSDLPDAEVQALLLFEEEMAREFAPPSAGALGDVHASRIQELERDLTATREQLGSAFELMQSSAADLQAATEEHQSTAEELQSANEELQTSNEELQSANEELRTVNDELQSKSDDLAAANRDLENILNSVLSGVIVLDRDMRVSRYSVASRQIFDLWPTSIGRPLIAIGSPLDLTLLASEIDSAIKVGRPVERELNLGKLTFLVRIIPLNDDHAISGLIIAFLDETERTRSEQEARRLATIMREARDSIVTFDLKARPISWNRGAEQLYGYSKIEAVNLSLRDLVPVSREKEAMAWFAQVAAGQASLSVKAVRRAKDGRELVVWLTTTLLRDAAGNLEAIAVFEREVSDRDDSASQPGDTPPPL